MIASKYYGMDIYSDGGNYVGEVREVVLDIDEGKVAGLSFERRGEKQRMIPYENVMAVGDVILVESREQVFQRAEKREE
ncbi:hypothetical protein AKJ44_01290 [candidate division MSBL1 archaeon SCGC-AAA261F17]|uniref:PRC-barrel domain-containing protein n=1 Tax=candidate division MSBL1 archaeon SCGC-AAA261F17 TaxID=1698274 RepID=A0A133V6W1_9EURY|nr:hypothetical protein AKJ44_01290 [candidate division MSBL1 archaeon SCGC-AAA261F17]